MSTIAVCSQHLAGYVKILMYTNPLTICDLDIDAALTVQTAFIIKSADHRFRSWPLSAAKISIISFKLRAVLAIRATHYLGPEGLFPSERFLNI